MKRSTYSGFENVKGLANVRFSPDNTKAAVFFQDKEKYPEPYKLTEFPKFLLNLDQKERQQLWFVELNNNSTIWQIRPAFGLLETEFTNFAAKNDQIKWEYKSYTYKERLIEYHEFYPIYVATDPKYEGEVSLATTLRYNVRDENGFVVLYNRGDWTDLLEKWLIVHGIKELDFPWKDGAGVLQDWEKAILRQGNTKVTHSMDNGYSASWYATPNVNDDAEVWEEADKEVEQIWKDEESPLPPPSNKVEPVEEEFDFGEDYS